MIRLAYVSKKQDYLSDDDIIAMVSKAADSNKKNNITGILIRSGDIFFQILEGEEEQVLHLFHEKISKDQRHSSIIKVMQNSIPVREYSAWHMNLISLDDDSEITSDPVRSMLNMLSGKILEVEEVSQAAFSFVRNVIVPNSSHTINKIVFFSDIVSFSALSENLEPGLVIELLNKYMNVVTRNIILNGGRVSKVLGDGLMAYFDEDQVDNAVNASLQILSDLQGIRRSAGDDIADKVLYTGIGLAAGPVIEGNVGNDLKNNYTIIGDSVNLASRLESMTRTQKRSLIFSSDIKDILNPEWEILEMGKHIIKGKVTPIELYSIRSQFTSKEKTGIEHEWEIGNFLTRVNEEKQKL